MNKGMPNASALGAKALRAVWLGTPAGPLASIWGWFVELILKKVLFAGGQEGLVVIDLFHMNNVVNAEMNNYIEQDSTAWTIAEKGKILTKEEADEINKPVIDALVKFGTFNRVLNEKNKNT